MTKLRLLCVVILSLASPLLAASHPVRARTPLAKVVASPKNFKWCDLHVCEEPPHYVGTASYYGRERQGKKMANGQRFDRRKLTAACWFLPMGTEVEVLNLRNGKTVRVEITDRGPAHRLHRVIDLSQTAAEAVDLIRGGLSIVVILPPVEVGSEPVATTLGELQMSVDNAEIADTIKP